MSKGMSLEWEKSGHSGYYARVGRLAIAIKRTPLTVLGGRKWRVGEVFGNHHLGLRTEFDDAESAMRACEKTAIAALRDAAKALNHDARDKSKWRWVVKDGWGRWERRPK